MGNWHCIPSSCATVHYREYESPKIRWRYGNEPWQEINGNDYSITEKIINPHQYLWYWEATVTWKDLFSSNRITRNYTVADLKSGSYIIGIIVGYPRFDLINLPDYNNSNLLIPYEQTNAQGQISLANYNLYFARSYRPESFVLTKLCISPGGSNPYQCANPQPSKNCVFTVTKNGQTVYQETRAVCPEVQKIPCRLNDVNKQIEIKKLPFLEKIEVVPYQYSAYKLPGIGAPINQADPIPSQCLNIYNNAIYVIPPSGQGIYPNATPFNSLVTQICSAVGCPPPEYQVICDCNNCESCPNGTCPVECDEQICCYGSDGISVKAISLSNYCGDQL